VIFPTKSISGNYTLLQSVVNILKLVLFLIHHSVVLISMICNKLKGLHNRRCLLTERNLPCKLKAQIFYNKVRCCGTNMLSDPMCHRLVSLLITENSRPLKRVYFTIKHIKRTFFRGVFCVSTEREFWQRCHILRRKMNVAIWWRSGPMFGWFCWPWCFFLFVLFCLLFSPDGCHTSHSSPAVA